jgi:hypothetical protein
MPRRIPEPSPYGDQKPPIVQKSHAWHERQIHNLRPHSDLRQSARGAKATFGALFGAPLHEKHLRHKSLC